ncbi:flagellar biosynthesis protein FlhA [Desulfonatronovibrio hydrogenovorans]|uniref:flagellar biosynthesis protein FlhA n=1 Tax=Desulfonatronovibrio hydrogenovorans TaxID=53245 RepID=UPI00048BE244|nr:flagellar biosynthesis protein FlhA [Desulfonatronovibrio hydrogenovorans]
MSVKSSVANLDYSKFTRQGDILLASGVVIILFVMLVPLPTIILDIMLTFNLSFAFVILMTAMFIKTPLEFTIFPSLLLVTTLMRLAINVATTRLILLHGDTGTNAAGKVVESFGSFVVGGNYLIGIVIFLILFALNKMVIATGTTRIAEVAARFTLDSLPGKQMSIEADLNAGLIDENEAKRQREAIRKESDFYGAMDGAGKFVSGDVKAGMLITVINIVGGLLIGIFQQGMSWNEAAQTYTLLTIGDGLVATIPSIIISTSAGIIVSRAAAEAQMGEEFIAQLTNHPRALRLVAGVLFLFGMVPGMPTFVFLLLSGFLFTVSFLAQGQKDREEEKRGPKRQDKKPSLETPEEVHALLPLDILELEVGYGLIPLVDEEQSGNLLARIRSIRRQFAVDMGVVIPSLHLRDNLQLKPGEYAVLIKGNQVARAEIMIDHFLAMDPGDAKHRIKGIETLEPAFNLPALWIPENKKEEAAMAGYTVVDPSTVIATHLTEIFKHNLHEFLGRQETQALLDNLGQRAPKAVEELVPGTLSLGVVQKVLQNLVKEKVSIRDLLTIIETLSDYGQQTKDPEQLTEFVRQKMGRTIVKPFLGEEGTLSVISMEDKIEAAFQDGLRQTDHGTYLAMEPKLAQKIIQAISRIMEKTVVSDGQPVLLTTPVIRPHLAQLLLRFVPNLPVISQTEIPSNIRLESANIVSLKNAD